MCEVIGSGPGFRVDIEVVTYEAYDTPVWEVSG